MRDALGRLTRYGAAAAFYHGVHHLILDLLAPYTTSITAAEN